MEEKKAASVSSVPYGLCFGFLVPGVWALFIAGQYAGRIACYPVVGRLLRGLLALALYVGILYRVVALFLGFRGGYVRFSFFG